MEEKRRPLLLSCIPSFDSGCVNEMLKEYREKLKHSQPVKHSYSPVLFPRRFLTNGMSSFPLDPQTGCFCSPPKCLYFYPYYLAFVGSLSEYFPNPSLHLVAGYISTLLRPRRRADRVKTENNPKHVLVHV